MKLSFGENKQLSLNGQRAFERHFVDIARLVCVLNGACVDVLLKLGRNGFALQIHVA